MFNLVETKKTPFLLITISMNAIHQRSVPTEQQTLLMHRCLLMESHRKGSVTLCMGKPLTGMGMPHSRTEYDATQLNSTQLNLTVMLCGWALTVERRAIICRYVVQLISSSLIKIRYWIRACHKHNGEHVYY